MIDPEAESKRFSLRFDLDLYFVNFSLCYVSRETKMAACSLAATFDCTYLKDLVVVYDCDFWINLFSDESLYAVCKS